jgi:hypothetical protein
VTLHEICRVVALEESRIGIRRLSAEIVAGECMTKSSRDYEFAAIAALTAAANPSSRSLSIVPSPAGR